MTRKSRQSLVTHAAGICALAFLGLLSMHSSVPMAGAQTKAATPPGPPGKSDVGASPRPSASGIGTVKDVVKDTVAGMASGVKAALPQPPVAADPAKAAADRMATLRRKILKEEDFAENEETNRDPFHSYFKLFTSATRTKVIQTIPSIFDKFALEELTLIAIISGDANPMAMFRDPTGFGLTVKRGDYLSRVAARVTKILSDRVIVELTEDTGSGPPKIVEKSILVNPEEAEKE